MSTGRVVVMDKHQRIQGATLSVSTKNFPVFKGVNTVGRNKTAVIDIKHLSVSQNQAVIVIVDDQQHFVSDLGSSNGTFLHDTQLVPFKLYELTNDAVLRFGTITAKYLKPTNHDVTINLDSEPMNITQNMTQTFYAADTQLFNNQTISGPNITSQDIHGLETQPVDYPLKPTVNITANDIHTMETQPADYPFQPPLVPVGKNKKNTGKEDVENLSTTTKVHNVNGNITEESHKCDEADTAIEETATQVDDYSLKPLKDHNEYVKKLYRDDSENVALTAGSEQFIGECFEDPYYHNNTNMDFSFPEETNEDAGGENIAECNQSDQNALKEANSGTQSKIVPADNEKADTDPEATQIENLEVVATKESQPKPVPADVIEDSFATHPRGSSDFVDDSMADCSARGDNMEENSNESLDLLTMPFTVDSTNSVENVASHEENVKAANVQETAIENAECKVNSDSETDIDSTEEMIIRKKPTRKLDSESLGNLSNIQERTSQTNIDSISETKKTNKDSDSETDIEDDYSKTHLDSDTNKSDNNRSVISETQQIKPVRISRKPLFQSDSDTENEDEPLPAKKDDVPESATKSDIETASGIVPSSDKNKGENLEESGIQSNGNDGDTSDIKLNEVSALNEKTLNDTDCIPATQDAFASVFSYKGNEQNHSSEESFKLGLTELMVDDADCNMENQADSSDKISQPNASKDKETVPSDSGDEPQIETCENDSQATEEMADLLGSKKSIEQSEDKLVDDHIGAAKDDANDNDYILPTQKMDVDLNIDPQTTKNNEETCDDYYLMPTQEIENKSPFKVPTKKYTFKNKKVLLDATMSTLLNVVKEDDMYIAPTQMMGSEPEDVYMQATQSISEKPAGTGTKSTEDDDDLYGQATQQITFDKKTMNTSKDDVYLMATQAIQENKDLEPPESSNTTRSEDVYDIATQVISNEPSDSQTEIQNYNKSVVTSVGGIRPENPLAQVLQVEYCTDSKKTLKRSNKDSLTSSKSKKMRKSDIESLKMKIEEDAETLSQIEAFVHKPMNEIKKPDEIKNTGLSLRKTKRQVTEDVETLSQIEAFVNKPVESKPLLQVKIEAMTRDDNPEKTVFSRKRSRRVIKDCSDLDIPDELGNETIDTSKDVSLDKNETFFNQSKELEVKSEVDQSFAIMASKVNRTKKNVKKTSSLCEIRVKDVKRTSMDIAEASKIQEHEIQLPSRKSRRFTTGNTSSLPPTKKNKSSSLKKKISETKIPEKPLGSATSVTDKNENISTKISKDPKKGTQKTEMSKSYKLDERPCDRKNAEDNKEPAARSSKRTIKPTLKAEQSELAVGHVKRRTMATPKAEIAELAVGNSKRRTTATPKVEIAEQLPSEDSASLSSPGQSKGTPKRKQRPKVIFTMMDDPQLESYIKQIGGSVVDSIETATVLVTKNIKRTQKLLTAVGHGKPICSPEWIKSSKKKHEFLDPWDFLLVDKEAEKKWDFSLKLSLERASKKALLTDYTFHLMVTEATDVLKGAIEACGGKCVSRVTKKLPEGNFVIIASPAHKSKYSKVIKENPEVRVVEPEAIFDGVLRQELRLSQYTLI